jgi:hypothetical protein
MGRTLRRLAAAFISVVVVAIPLTAHSALLTDQRRAERAVAFLASKQRPNGSIVAFSPVGSTADAVVAFVAAGVGRTRMGKAIGYLRTQVAAGKVGTVGLQAKVVLAVSAAGLDPRAFGGKNLIKALRDTVSGGHFGSSAVFDDAMALLAIESAGVTPGSTTANWLLAAQCPDGGWAYDQPYEGVSDDAHCYDGSPTDYFSSDSNTTSYVVQALTNMSKTDWVADPFAFFPTVRDHTKGWGYSAGFTTDANSTALVLQAYATAGLPTPSGGMTALRKLRYPACGAFAYSYDGSKKTDPDVGATIGAVPGILRATFPLSGRVRTGLPRVKACA